MLNKYLLSIPIFLLLIFSCSTNQVDLESERQQVKMVLDDFIVAHETKDLDLLSSCFSVKPDILILGTDKDELWVDKKSMVDAQRRAYAAFDKVKLSVREKVLKMDKSGKTSWFYMKVDWFVESKGEKYKFDVVRTTGVLENVGGKWQIVPLYRLKEKQSAIELLKFQIVFSGNIENMFPAFIIYFIYSFLS